MSKLKMMDKFYKLKKKQKSIIKKKFEDKKRQLFQFGTKTKFLFKLFFFLYLLIKSRISNLKKSD